MGKVSTMENKSPYQLRREELGLSRDKASELLESITPERLVRIENGKFLAQPDEIMTMAEKYKMPNLCNHYCSNECPIGRQYVPEIKIDDLSQIVLKMLASLNSISNKKERLIEITADGSIDEKEMEDFVHIQEELEKISVAVEALQLWSEKMLADNIINKDLYNAYISKTK